MTSRSSTDIDQYAAVGTRSEAQAKAPESPSSKVSRATPEIRKPRKRTGRKKHQTPSEKAPATNPSEGGVITTFRDDAGKPIGGKLGFIACAVSRPEGASITDLVSMTGWQPHTVRSALSRLRCRLSHLGGIQSRLNPSGSERRYQCGSSEQNP